MWQEAITEILDPRSVFPYDELLADARTLRTNMGYDTSAIYENLAKLSPGKNIIIKSTVLPGETKLMSERYPYHKFFFNPEFLRAKTANADFISPDRQIVGYANKKNKVTAWKILEALPTADYQKICSSTEAEMVKLIGNDFLALKVVFANEMYEYCQEAGVDYKEVIHIVKQDKRIGSTHLDIFGDHGKSGRGYGGFCFPKDMKATIFDSGSKLLQVADKLNNKYLKK